MRSLHGHHHLCVAVKDPNRGGRLTHLIVVEGQPLWPVFEYFCERDLAFATEKVYAFATGLLVDFVAANACHYRDITKRAALFNAFAHAVLNGTILNGQDPTGLWWHSRTRARAKRLLALACEVSDALAELFGTVAINPVGRRASPAEKLVFWRRWNTQKAASLLGHRKAPAQATPRAAQTREVAVRRGKSEARAKPLCFPDQFVESLLFDGFISRGHQRDRRPWVRWNLRDILITILLHYGGLRISEPMHLWVDDIFVDPSNHDCARVLVHHPFDGICEIPNTLTGRLIETTRVDYLRAFCGRVPLTEETGHRHAGWKNSLLNNRERRAFEVVWSSQSMGELFLKLFRLYIKHVRPVTAKHPYLFVTKDGDPMGTLTFTKNHGRAVNRIGLDAAKGQGTTPHGHRHAYAQRLEAAGLNQKEKQVLLHHVSIHAQEIYTQADLQDAAARMRDAEKKGRVSGGILNIPTLIAD